MAHMAFDTYRDSALQKPHQQVIPNLLPEWTVIPTRFGSAHSIRRPSRPVAVLRRRTFTVDAVMVLVEGSLFRIVSADVQRRAQRRVFSRRQTPSSDRVFETVGALLARALGLNFWTCSVQVGRRRELISSASIMGHPRRMITWLMSDPRRGITRCVDVLLETF